MMYILSNGSGSDNSFDNCLTTFCFVCDPGSPGKMGPEKLRFFWRRVYGNWCLLSPFPSIMHWKAAFCTVWWLSLFFVDFLPDFGQEVNQRHLTFEPNYPPSSQSFPCVLNPAPEYGNSISYTHRSQQQHGTHNVPVRDGTQGQATRHSSGSTQRHAPCMAQSQTIRWYNGTMHT